VSVLSGINDIPLTDEAIKVYPLPAEDIVTIVSEAFIGCPAIRVELLDYTGKIVYQGTYSESSGSIQLPVYNLASGVYIARIFFDNKVAVVKVAR
jgi:hypothetical protein